MVALKGRPLVSLILKEEVEMKKLIVGLLTAGIIGTNAIAGQLVELSDSELEEVYAQGISINASALDSIDFSGTINGDVTFSDIGNIQQIIIDTPQMNLNGSVVLSDNAQQNAFMPINISNSSVNMPINIIIITGDNNGSIDIQNVLDAMNGANAIP